MIDPALRWIDVADEVAFLFADLAASHAELHAHAFVGGYLDQSGDFQACRVLNLYKAHRALERSKVLALNAAEGGGASDSQRLLGRRRYLSQVACARTALERKRPKLILIAGISGTVKTWLAERIAPSLRAVHLRSDIERKRVAGIGETDRCHSALGGGIYEPKVNEAVYERLARCARSALEGGFTVIVDATFQRRSDRARLSRMAEELGVRTHLVLCHASQVTLERRITERARRAEDPSEADLSVMRAQHAVFDPIDESERMTVMDAATEAPGIAEWVALELRSSY